MPARPTSAALGIAPQRTSDRRLRVAAYDLGIKYNILRRLDWYGCDVHGVSGHGARRGSAGVGPGRHLPEQRPRRPGGA